VEIYRSGAGKSGGQRQKLATTCLAAALRYQLGGEDGELPRYAAVVLDEAFDKADNEFTALAMNIFENFGFQMVVATPLKSVMTLEPFIGGACFVEISGRHTSGVLLIEYDEQQHRLKLPERTRGDEPALQEAAPAQAAHAQTVPAAPTVANVAATAVARAAADVGSAASVPAATDIADAVHAPHGDKRRAAKRGTAAAVAAPGAKPAEPTRSAKPAASGMLAKGGKAATSTKPVSARAAAKPATATAATKPAAAKPSAARRAAPERAATPVKAPPPASKTKPPASPKARSRR
jgi:hypothetical protein